MTESCTGNDITICKLAPGVNVTGSQY